MVMAFEDWIEDSKHIVINNGDQIWESSSLITMITQGKNIETYIQNKNQELREKYISDGCDPYRQKINEMNREIGRLEKSYTEINDVNVILDNYRKDIESLNKYFTTAEEQMDIKQLLLSYSSEGKFNRDKPLKNLTAEPKGFFNRLLHGKKHKKAQQALVAFIEKYEKDNIPDKISKCEDTSVQDCLKEDTSVQDCLKYKFMAITQNDSHQTSIWSDKIKQRSDKLESEKNEKEKAKDTNEQKLKEEQSGREESFNKSLAKEGILGREKTTIINFCKEIRDEILNPKTLKIADYVECLDSLSDEEIVMFNIGLRGGKSIANKTKNVLDYNGLICGEDTNQWLLREEKVQNSDEGKYEIFSPLLSVKEAKEIMPKLMADLDRAHVSSGLAIPIKATNIFKEQINDVEQSTITSDGLMKLIGGAFIKTQMKMDKLYDVQEGMHMIGIESEKDLPQVFSSLEEIKLAYPKKEYLFSGSTASDDYLPLSARAGRNGIIYATPDISYAAKYDGVTDVGKTEEGTTATGDKYVSSVIGQVYNDDVKVGFINVYKQNDNDQFFCNFGMEDCRELTGEKTSITYNIFEPNSEGKDPYTEKQAQTAINGRLTKEQAINGYIERGSNLFENNGKYYSYLSLNSETYITPDKNPLVAKIMHIRWGENEYFVPVPKEPTETMLAILNKRQAKMEDTFSHNERSDILNRMQKQKEEFNQGNIAPVRENGFIKKQQAQLVEGLGSSHLSEQKQENTEKKEMSEAKKILILQGRIQPSKHDNKTISSTQRTAPSVRDIALRQLHERI